MFGVVKFRRAIYYENPTVLEKSLARSLYAPVERKIHHKCGIRNKKKSKQYNLQQVVEPMTSI